MTDKIIFQGSVRAGKTAAIIATLTAECARLRADLEWLVYWCLRADDPPISIGRGKELLGFTDMMQMRAWMADYSYRDNWGGNERDV
jgi:hypothetical protein